MYTNVYDALVVPLLQRMSNLEKLGLYLIVCGKQSFIDGSELKKTIINHMSRLIKFSFNIRSIVRLHNNQINLPSNEDIQHTFKDFEDNQIVSCVDFFPKDKEGQCHIYSYPYRLEHYYRITNNFPGGFFKNVSVITLFDEHPFEHEFFLRIAQSFPFMKSLTLNNSKPQKNKLYNESNNENQDLQIIKYSYLTELHLSEAHDDYIEQFLVDSKTCLPNNVRLFVHYRPMKRVTQNFTRNTTQLNCAKLISLCLLGKRHIHAHVKAYFPCARVF
jgi:hypothetical protein